MNNVRILSPELIAKIAAGEVIERPASVVKELIENSLDAKATVIEITLKDAGRTLIRIKDNGFGVSEENLQHVFQRHATSKISSIEDLYHIDSLGFRGEALFSIGAISDVTLRSQTNQDAHGWEIHVRANQKISKKPCSLTKGTDIAVQELFFNTPARRKFLKSNSTELNHLIDTVIPYSLLFPHVRMSLTHNERVILDLAATQSLTQRLAECLHIEQKDIVTDTFISKESPLTIHLALGDINIQRTRKDMQFIYINNRPVMNKTISFHLNDIYRLLLSPGIYPFFYVSLSLPPEDIDVNVHPAKREVKLKDETKLVATLRHFTEKILMTKSKPKHATTGVFAFPGKNLAAEEKKDTAASEHTISTEETLELFNDRKIPLLDSDSLKQKLQKSLYIGSFLKKYLLFESPDSLLIIDQHAAQERITFERLKTQIDNRNIEVQQLLTPIMIALSPQEIILWEESKERLEETGFSTTLFDKNTLALHAHPNLITQPEQSIRNLLTGIPVLKMSNEAIARLACRSSVMAGTKLNKEHAEYQRTELLLCKDMFICPHGRPTIVEIKEAQLSKQFLRP